MNVKRAVSIATATAALTAGIAVSPANAEGLIPNTEGALRAGIATVEGSVDAGSSINIAVSVAGLGLIGYGAKAAGVLPPQLAGQLPF
ncbi:MULTISPECIES: hypothetical protein [Corynebacterium]|uniref:Secreted protein n=1 Tax=Corynebacterium ihumii TaxID=1232427 RepID=A0ABY7UG08_9CORY|nr:MULTISPECIES: hypothetical protein [Corynebacterium]WCZ35569.1 hypothetical protein CIHUM_10905 [Corynebacterium ihumii]